MTGSSDGPSLDAPAANVSHPTPRFGLNGQPMMTRMNTASYRSSGGWCHLSLSLSLGNFNTFYTVVLVCYVSSILRLSKDGIASS